MLSLMSLMNVISCKEVVRIRGGKIVSEITDDSPSASTPQKSMTGMV